MLGVSAEMTIFRELLPARIETILRGYHTLAPRTVLIESMIHHRIMEVSKRVYLLFGLRRRVFAVWSYYGVDPDRCSITVCNVPKISI